MKDLLQTLLQVQMDGKWFNTRNSLNHEKALFLLQDVRFLSDVTAIKKNFGIPKLNPKVDHVEIRSQDFTIEDSDWLRGKSEAFIDEWERQIKVLLTKYGLPLDFIDWIEWNILYGKPKNYPHYNIEVLIEIIKDPEAANRAQLTSSEKELFIAYLGFIVKSAKGKRKNTLKKSFPTLKRSLQQSKNNRRRLRTLGTAMKALKKPKSETSLDMHKGHSGEYVTKHYSYNRLATEILNVEKEEETKKASARLRKQKERLLKRHI